MLLKTEVIIDTMSKNSKWNNTKISKFLEIYEKYDVLWNNEIDEYRRKEPRDRNMVKLVAELNNEGFNVDAEEVRRRIKSIKTTYSEELRKIDKSKKSGAGIDDVYEPKLSWFSQADRFLNNVTASRKSTTNLVIMETVLLEEEKEQSSFELEGEALPPKRKDTSIKKDPLSEPVKQKKAKTSLDRVEMAITDLNKIAQATAVAPDDELDHFGKYVTASLKKLPLINALTCQEQIQRIINTARIAVVSGETPLGLE